jgi:uncharacterized protein (DUF58 family)
VFDDADVVAVRPHRSRRRVMEVLGAVVVMNHRLRADTEVRSNPAMLNQVLEQAAQTAKHDALVCVISDFHGADDDTRRLLTLLAHHNDVICALLYDPIKVALPAASRLVVSDGELQLELDTASGKTRQDLSQHFADDLQRTKEVLAKVGVPVMLIDTVDDPADQVRRILGEAVGRGRR